MHVVNPLYDSTSPFPELDVSSLSPCCNPHRMLTVEPLPFPSLVQELHQPPQSMSTACFPCPVQHSLHGYHPRHPFCAPTAQTGIRGSWVRTTTLVHHRQSADWWVSPSRVIQAQTQNSPYPRCTSNYSVTRLRSTCSLRAFWIMERIWVEEVVQPTMPLVNGDTQETPSPLTTGNQPASGTIFLSASEKPPNPPR